MVFSYLQFFNITPTKSPSSDIQWVCLVTGDKSVGFSLISWSRFIVAFGHVFSFKYWIFSKIGLQLFPLCVMSPASLIAQDTTMVSAVSSGGSLENTGNGSIEFSFGQLLYANEIAGSYHVNQRYPTAIYLRTGFIRVLSFLR